MKRKHEIPSGFTVRKRFLAILMALLMVLGYMPTMAWAAPGDPDEVTEEAEDETGPKHSKAVTPNGDGTYTIGLDVTGEADTTSTTTTANILVIFDTSNSMTWRAANPTGQYGTNGNGSTTFQLYKANGDAVTDAENYTGTVYQRGGNGPNYNYTEYTGTRLQTNSRALEAEKIIYDFAKGLYEYDGVEMALVSFNSNASLTQGWTDNKEEFLDNLYDGGVEDEEAQLDYNSGTNWEAALRMGADVLDDLNDEDPVDTDSNFVVFVTDGAPSKYLDNNGAVTPAGNNFGNAEDCYKPAKDEALAIQSFKPTGTEKSNTELFGIYTYGVEADYLDDVIYSALNGKDRETERAETDTEGVEENYFNASNTVELQNAVSTIFQKIANTLGIEQAAISDGTTSNVETTSGVAHLLDVDETSYKYWLLIPINEDGTFTRVNPSTGDEITYTTAASGGKVTISWKEGNENKSVIVNGSVSSDELKYQWEEKNAFYNFDPPAASLTDGTVKWDLSPVKTLLDGVTYRVTFDVWPSQTTLDYIADIENDPYVDENNQGAWGELDSSIQKYLDKDGNLKTNTGASLTYVDTRLENPGPYTKEYIDPDPVETGAAEMMTVSKEWENKLDEEAAEEVNLAVNCDGEKKYQVTLNNANHWKDDVYISFGIMSVADKNVILRTTGHDFNFSEPENLNILWEVKAPTVHPMLINEDKVMLVKVEDKEELAKITGVDETKTDGTYYKIGDNYYKEDETASSLTAVNERKSQLDLTKVVDDVKAPKDALFTYDVKIDDADQNDIKFVLLDENEAPVENTEETTYISGSGLKADEKDAGYYSVPSGTELTIKMPAGWKVSFLNLATETTYDITESEMGKGFVFNSVDGERTYKDADDKEVTESAGGTGTDDRNYSGTIDYTNSVYTVTYKNDYELTNFDVKKVWKDADDQDGIRPDSVTVKLLKDGEETGETATMSSDTEWACRFEELEKYKDERVEIVYTIEEVETEVITGKDGPETYAYKVEGDVKDGFTVTNTHTPQLIEIEGEKTWNDEKYFDKDGKAIGNYERPKSITIELTGSDGKKYSVELDGTADTDKPTEAGGYETDAWKFAFINLPKNADGKEIEYKLSEIDEEGFTSEIKDYNVINTPDEKKTVEDTSITINKIDANTEGGLEGAVFTLTDSEGKETIYTTGADGTVKIKFEGYTTDKDVEKAETRSYTLAETTPPEGYTDNDAKYKVTVSEDLVSVKKSADSENNIVWEWLYNQIAAVDADFDEETGILTVINPPEETFVHVKKIWEDNDNQDGVRPEKVTVNLLADGEKVDSQTLSKDNEWEYTWKELSGYADGKLVEYSVTEEKVDKYTTEVRNVTKEDAAVTDGYEWEVTNYHQSEPKKTVYKQGNATMIDGKIVNPGDKLTYQITYMNTTGEEADAVITDKIPAYTMFVSADNGGTEADGTVTWNLPKVKNGESKTVSMVVEVQSNAEGQTLKNTGKLRIGNNEYDTNEVTNWIPTDPKKDVFAEGDMTTSIDGKIVNPGDKLTYTVTYTNTTGETAEEVTITDKIPAYTTFESADNDGIEKDGTVTWNLKNVENGDSVTVSFVVTVYSDAEGKTLKNTAKVRVGENEYDTNEVTNSVPTDPKKTVYKEGDTTTMIDGKIVNPGDKLTYQITYTNTTGEEADAVITDKIPAYTTFVSADNGGTEEDGTVTWNLTGIENGGNRTVTMVVEVENTAIGQTLKNTGKVRVGENEYETNEVTNWIPTDPTKDVFAEGDTTTSIDGKIVNPGDKLTYTITYTNTTGETADAEITDKLPAYTTFVSADNGGAEANGTVTWTLKEVKNGESKTVSMVVEVKKDSEGQTLKNTAKVRVGENEYETNEVTNWIPTVPKKDVFKEGDTTTSIDGKIVNPGDKLTYQITYTNTTGEEADAVITDKIPAYTTFVSADNGGTEADGTVTWNLTGIKNGDSRTVTMVVEVGGNAAGQTLKNTGKVRVGENEYETNEVTNWIPTDPTKDVFAEGDTTTSIDGKIVNPGDKLTYTITYTNTTGETADAEITDKLPAYTTFVSADNEGAEADGTVTWTLKEVKNGESKTVSMVVEVKKDSEGQTLKNTAKVRVGENEYETNEVTNWIPTVPKKDVFKEGDTTTSIDGKIVNPGDKLTYQITYTNTTGEEADAVITDKIPAYTKFVSADNSGTEADGTVTWNLTGIKNGDSRTVTMIVEVENTAIGQTLKNTGKVRVGENEYETNEVTNSIPTDPTKDVFAEGDTTTSIDGKQVKPGDKLTYTITYKNTTGVKADAVVTDQIPAYTSFVSANYSGIEANGTVLWNLKDVGAGESRVLNLVVLVNNDAEGQTLKNKAKVIVGENEYETNEVTNYIPTDPVKSVYYESDPETSIEGEYVDANEILLYKVDYTNTTGEDAEVTITDAIPEHTAYVDGSADQGGTYADGVITWNLSVAKDASTTVTFKVKVDEDVDGDTIINKAVARVGENDYETNEVINPTTEKILDTDNHFGYIIGYPVDYETGEKTDDKNRWPVRPTADITRAEVSTVFFRMLLDEKRSEYWTKENNFSDVSKSNWYNNAISVMAAMGILKGYSDGTFMPNKAITRAEMATIAARFARMTGVDVTTNNTFTDIEGHWAKKDIEFSAAVGWVNGYPDGSFHPEDNITRAEFMTLANRMLERQPEEESDLLGDMIAWPDNSPSDWWYLAVQEATNSHKYIRKGVTVPDLTFEYETWIEMLAMRDWSALEKEWSDADSAPNPDDSNP